MNVSNTPARWRSYLSMGSIPTVDGGDNRPKNRPFTTTPMVKWAGPHNVIPSCRRHASGLKVGTQATEHKTCTAAQQATSCRFQARQLRLEFEA